MFNINIKLKKYKIYTFKKLIVLVNFQATKYCFLLEVIFVTVFDQTCSVRFEKKS